MTPFVWTNEPPTEPGPWMLEVDNEVYYGFVRQRWEGSLVFTGRALDDQKCCQALPQFDIPGARWCPIPQPAEPTAEPEPTEVSE